MANIKRVSSSYTIMGTSGNTAVSIGDPTSTSAQLTVNGNVVLPVNSVSAITIAGGAISGVGIRWDEAVHKWTLSNDGAVYSPIQTVQQSGITAVFDDKAPELGGNLNVNTYIITSGINNNIVLSPSLNAQINSSVQLLEITGPITAVANFNIITANVPSHGASGLYVTNSYSTQEELITRRQAFFYSLILG